MIRTSSLALLALSLAAASGDDGPRTRRDVPYSDASPSMTLNVDAPREGDGHPIVVWIHGGGWRRGDKDNVGEKPKAFNGRGYAWVGVGYRFIPEVTPREQAGDVARAVRWARDHAQEFGGDPGRIFLMGHSAGAHLAALTATDERPLQSAGLKPSDIAGVILLDGAGYDVPRQVREARLPALRRLYLDAFGEDPKAQEEASPIAHVAKGRGIPPFLILHVGRVDSGAQAEALAARLREAGVAATVGSFPSKTHMTINRELGAAGDRPTRAVFEFLGANARRATRSGSGGEGPPSP